MKSAKSSNFQKEQRRLHTASKHGWPKSITENDTCFQGIYTPSHCETDRKLQQDRFRTDSFGRFLGHQRLQIVTVLAIQLAQNEQLDFGHKSAMLCR